MLMHAVRLFFLLAALGHGSLLKSTLQRLVDELSQEHGFALQLAWKSAEEDFSVAAGRHPTLGREVNEEDTFAFGSGTKPYTSALLMKLAASGRLDLNRPAAKYVDSLFQRLNGTTLVGLFGPEAATVTVGHLLRMQSGLQDFDVASFDEQLLKKGSSLHSPWEFLRGAAAQQPPFLCKPGGCTSYSSTNYILAGFVALAASATGSSADWSDLDQSQIFPQPLDAKYRNCTFANTGPLSSSLSVPGVTGGRGGALISEQDASILGWTCGNLVSPASSAAQFFYDLLIEGRIVPSSVASAMQDFRPLDVGWAKGTIQYGTGLMIQQVSWNATYPPVLGSWGSYVGHGGDTYGFLSESGVISQLNASFSAIANEDYQGTFVKNVLVCNMIKVAAKVVLDQDVHLLCAPFPPHMETIAV